MDSLPLFRGVGIGLAVAAPVGPMSILCMRRTLTLGWRLGLNTGLGIATGDGIYAFIAAVGLADVSRLMLAYGRPLHVVAGLFLLYLGLKTFVKRTQPTSPIPARSSTSTGYLSALFLTLTNPPTIVSFAAIFTVLAPASEGVYASAQTVFGVFLGSTLWWLLLTSTVRIVRQALGRRTIGLIDGVSSAVLSAFGLAEIRKAL